MSLQMYGTLAQSTRTDMIKLVPEMPEGGCNGCYYMTPPLSGIIKCQNPAKRECVFCNSIYQEVPDEEGAQLMSSNLVGAELH